MKKRERQRLLAGALALFILEVGSWAAYRVLFPAEARRAFGVLLSSDTSETRLPANFVPHHYLNYALNPAVGERWSVNARGFRGPDVAVPKPAGTLRIACLGGSTTFGIAQLDDKLTYPRLLEEALLRRLKDARVEVVNAGVHGWTSAETLINFHFRVLELEPDAVVIYEGINDIFAMAAPDEGGADYRFFRQRYEDPHPPRRLRFVLRHSGLARLVYVAWRRATRGLPWDVSQIALAPAGPEPERIARLNAATGRHVQRNVESIVHLSRGRGILPVVATVGHGRFHSALPRLNERVRETARGAGALLADFEKRGADPAFYTDDQIHLTDEGNRALADTVADALLASPEFRKLIK